MSGAPCTLNSLAFLIRMILAIGSEIIWSVDVHLVVISEHRLREVAALALSIARDSLALGLWLPHTELFCDEAVFDHLVNVLFLCERAFVIEVHVAHLLAYVRLMHTLWVMPDEAVVYDALADKAAIDSVGVGGCGSLLMAARLYLIFA